MKAYKVLGLIVGLFTLMLSTNQVLAQSSSLCSYTEPQQLNSSLKYVGSNKKLYYQPGELAEIKIYVFNNGNETFFGDSSGCGRPVLRLGTARSKDRVSPLYTTLTDKDSKWVAPNRIKLDQPRLNPQSHGSFSFWVKMPEHSGIYHEYYDFVVDGVKWLNTDFVINFEVGDFNSEYRTYTDLIKESAVLDDNYFGGGKLIEVDVSQQKMYLKIGNYVEKVFPVSSGKPSTPTPYGRTTITLKQNVRVSGAWPHYIMPKWQTFRAGGYGIHALPSIRGDNGYYWSEALNHIGTPRSHGCIRLLPKDADYVYNWTQIGTPVWVHQ